MAIRQEITTDGIVMPCGEIIDTAKSRSEGLLTESQLSYCRKNNIPVAYDPGQIGWVLASATDDIAHLADKQFFGVDIPANRTNEPTQRINTVAPDYHLRPWHSDDVETYLSLLDDPDVWTWLPEAYPAPLTAEVAESLIELSNTSDHHQVQAVMRNGEVVGQARLEFDVDAENPAVAEISYWLGKTHWGKGIASELVPLFTSSCFARNPNINAIVARVHNDNKASRRALEKAGYSLDKSTQTDPDWMLFQISRS